MVEFSDVEIEPSPELAAITRRYVAGLTGKRGDVCRALFTDSEYLFYVGSDVDEVLECNVLRAGYVEHVDRVPKVTATCEDLRAIVRGDVGWSVWVGSLDFSGAEALHAYRFSFVFALQSDIWKIVHALLSTPRTNRELTGMDHTTFQRLISAAQGSTDTERTYGVEGTATIMFSDIANSTTLAAYVGDRAWTKSVARHFDDVRDIVEHHDGRIVKTLGDGTMSTFQSANAALKAATAIQTAAVDPVEEARFRLRIGLHAGDVVQNEGDFFGSVVNKAARIASIAEPGSVLISDVVRAMASDTRELAFNPLPPVELQGIDGKHQVFQLGYDQVH